MFVVIRGFVAAQGFGKLGFMRRTSVVSICLCKIPPARPRKSDLAVKFQAEGCKEISAKIPMDTKKREMSTSIKLIPLLLHIELNIGPSRNVDPYCGCRVSTIPQNNRFRVTRYRVNRSPGLKSKNRYCGARVAKDYIVGISD